MSDSRSEFLRVRGLRYHVRRWGDAAAPQVLLLHGWLDVSATWEPVARALLPRFQVLCPDWRGLGFSEWPQDGYWFPDYVADLEVIADHYSPRDPWLLVGHSMGGQVASLYAGLRPERVRKLACLDSLFLPDMPATAAPKRFRRWLEDLRQPPRDRTYDSFEDLAARIRHRHPELPEARARFVARCWGREDGFGRIRLCADPKHRMNGPLLYDADAAMAIWKEVTAATLFVDAGKSEFGKLIPPGEIARRRACFRDRREVRIEDGSHMLHFSSPEETAQRIAEFLAD